MATSLETPVVRVKPSSNVYTVLLIVAILVLAVATGAVVYDLMHNYGLSFAELFSGQQVPSV